MFRPEDLVAAVKAEVVAHTRDVIEDNPVQISVMLEVSILLLVDVVVETCAEHVSFLQIGFLLETVLLKQLCQVFVDQADQSPEVFLVTLEHRRKIDVLVVEVLHQAHCFVDILAEGDTALFLGIDDDVLDQRVDYLSVGFSQDLQTDLGHFFLADYSEPCGILEVASQIGNLIREADDAALPRCRQDSGFGDDGRKVLLPEIRGNGSDEMLAAVADNAVAHSICEVQMGEEVHHTEAVDLMLERRKALLDHEVGEDVLADVSERSVTQIMTYSDCPCQLVVESHGSADGRCDRGHVEHMLHSGADMVVARSEEDLGLVLEPSER